MVQYTLFDCVSATDPFPSLCLKRTLAQWPLHQQKIWFRVVIDSHLQCEAFFTRSNHPQCLCYNETTEVFDHVTFFIAVSKEKWFQPNFIRHNCSCPSSECQQLCVCGLICHCFIQCVTCPICVSTVTQRQNVRCLLKINKPSVSVYSRTYSVHVCLLRLIIHNFLVFDILTKLSFNLNVVYETLQCSVASSNHYWWLVVEV